MSRYSVLLTIACAWSGLISPDARSYFEPDGSGKPGVMNDIPFEKYKDFPTQWRLVTVRYREDSLEQRFTYANDLAWEAMKNLKPEYPDGAAFGKVGFIVEADPAFASSKVPSGARRFQLMIKDKKKYKDTDGWGYALFDTDGHLFNEDPKSKTLACAACHRAVPGRDYVFSRPISLLAGQKSMFTDTGVAQVVKFESRKTHSLFASSGEEAVKGTKLISSLEGPLQKNAFSGTLDEVIPLLMAETARASMPSTLFVNSKNYSLVIPSGDKAGCLEGKTLTRIVVVFNSKKVRDAKICH